MCICLTNMSADNSWRAILETTGRANAARCANASGTPPNVAFVIAGAARTFATPLILEGLRWHMVEALAAPSAHSRLFLHLKVADSPKLIGKLGESKYLFTRGVDGPRTVETTVSALRVALRTPWLRRLLAEVALVNGSGSATHATGWSAGASVGASDSADAIVRSALVPSEADGWRQHSSRCCARPYGRSGGEGSTSTETENVEERMILASLALQWGARALERHERAHGVRFDVVAYARPDLFIHTPVWPWCHWPSRTQYWTCLTDHTPDKASHIDALWVAPRGLLHLFTDLAQVHASCDCSAARSTTTSALSHKARATADAMHGSCCGGYEALLWYALKQHDASLAQRGEAALLPAAETLGCASQGVPAGAILRNVKRDVSGLAGASTRSSACGPSCRHASRHVCVVALNSQFVADAKWSGLQLSFVQLPWATGMALRRLFGSGGLKACMEATLSLADGTKAIEAVADDTPEPPATPPPFRSDTVDPLTTCQLLPSKWQEWVTRANGSKHSYFGQVRSAGASVGHLSALRRFEATHAPPLPAAVRNATLRFGFLGDSVTREVAFAWHAMAPSAVSLFVWSSDVAVLPPRTSAARALVESFVAGGHGVQACDRADRLDALFVGLGSLEHLPRGRGPISEAAAAAALKAHRALVVQHLRDAAALSARAGGKPVVLVGTLPADVGVLQLYPAKKDAFTRGWALAPRFAALEAEILNGAGAARSQRLNTTTALVAFLHPSELAARCPGVRCDGLHYGADFDSFACRASFALWYPFLSDFVLNAGVVARAATARANSCNAADNSDYCSTSLGARSLVSCAAAQPRNAIPFGQSCFCHDAQSPPLAKMRLKLPDRAQT